MGVLDMRLIVCITLIVLSAAMPANCAEEPIPLTRSSIGRRPHTSAPADRAPVRHRGLLQLTIQDTPKRSFSIPNRSAQNVSPIGITTVPPSTSSW
jgi:hypothetical protein